MPPPQTIAVYLAIVGLCMVAGWFIAFRNRPYLGLLGLAFLTLAGYVLTREAVRQAQEAHLRASTLTWIEIAALVVSVALFLAALWAAIQESRKRLREVREHFQAAEEAFVAMMEAERRKQERQEKKGK